MVKHDFLEKNRVKVSDIPLRSSRTIFLQKNRVKVSDIPLRSSRTYGGLNKW